MAKPKQTGKHKFYAMASSVTYESSAHPVHGEIFDSKLPSTTFKIKFFCTKCQAEVEVIRNAVKSQFDKALSGDMSHVVPPKRDELSKLGIPACSKWRAVQHVMAS